MSLFSEIGEAVGEVLADVEMNTADVRIRRVTGTTPGANPWDPATETYQIIKLDCVVFTKEAEYANGSLVVDRADEITASPWATVIEVDGVATNQRIQLDVRDSDEIIVDGDVRRTEQVVRVPAAGADVSVWMIRVVD